MIPCMQSALDEILASKAFHTWSPGPKPAEPQVITYGRGQSFVFKGHTYKNLKVDEKHYAPADLAEAWGVSTDLIRSLFRDEPGVLKIDRPATRAKRSYSTIRIPESVVVRVHTRLTSRPAVLK